MCSEYSIVLRILCTHCRYSITLYKKQRCKAAFTAVCLTVHKCVFVYGTLRYWTTPSSKLGAHALDPRADRSPVYQLHFLISPWVMLFFYWLVLILHHHLTWNANWITELPVETKPLKFGSFVHKIFRLSAQKIPLSVRAPNIKPLSIAKFRKWNKV